MLMCLYSKAGARLNLTMPCGRKAVISVYGLHLLNHIELRGSNGTGQLLSGQRKWHYDQIYTYNTYYLCSLICHCKTKRSEWKINKAFWFDMMRLCGPKPVDPEVKGLPRLPYVWFRDYTGTALNAICSERHQCMSPLSTQFPYHHTNVSLERLAAELHMWYSRYWTHLTFGLNFR